LEFSPQVLSVLVLASLAINLVLVFLIASGQGFRRRSHGSGEPIQLDDALQAILDGHERKLARLEDAARKLALLDKRQGQQIRGAVQHVGMVRYDAFEDVGGRLSFSCALLDDRGDGVVMTSINGRQDTRVYAKPISGGRSSHNLSEEEDAAIQQALAGPREAVSAG
jgi:hypothetical protein